MNKMGLSLVLFLLLLTLGQVCAEPNQRYDLTQMTYPLLIGEWYYLSDNRVDETSTEPSAMRLLLTSDRQYALEVLYGDETTEQWRGNYAVNDDQLILNSQTSSPQVYLYANNHNQLILNGVTFFKMADPSLAGIWYSDKLSGYDIQGRAPTHMTLVLQPDFVFFIRSADDVGHEAIYSGLYYTELDHLVLLYQGGGHDTQFTLINDTLTWNIDDGAMEAVMTRQQR